MIKKIKKINKLLYTLFVPHDAWVCIQIISERIVAEAQVKHLHPSGMKCNKYTLLKVKFKRRKMKDKYIHKMKNNRSHAV